jgi:gliding motility-associated-like protein
LSNANTATLTVTVTVDGAYTFRLVVTDDDGATDFDDVVLTVNPAIVNQAPTADAGANQSITLPVNSLTLTGTGTDPDGSIASYQWSKISGPTATLTNATTAVLSLSDLVEGTYILRLTVTDNGGLTATDDVIVTVLPALVNQPPVADAGVNKTLTLPTNTITLFGSASDADGTVVSYAWVQLSGPAGTLANENTPNLSLSNLLQGTYTFQLTVTDDDGATDSDNVTLTVNAVATNQNPVANAGTDKTITLPTNIANLTGTGSDADGSIVRYDWVKVSGPAVTLGATNQPTLSLSNLVEGVYVFRLEVEDDDGATDQDDVTVTVLPQATNQSPVVTAGADKTIFLPNNSVIITGTASDPDGSIVSYQWTQVAGTAAILVNETSATVTISGLAEGTYRFRLTVADNQAATSFDEVVVTVNPATANQPPIANAGPDVSIKLPTNFITLTGSATDIDGTIAGYSWIKVSGPSATLSNQATSDLTISNMVEGVYVFELTATDNSGDADTDLVQVTVLPAAVNTPPVVSAGADISISLPTNNTIITGTATDDGTIASLLWTKVSGPAATLSGDLTTTLTVTGLVEGTYVFQLTATDDGGLTDADQVTVIVLPEIQSTQPPTVDAGADQTIQLPTNTATVVALGDSPNGVIESYLWTQTGGEPVTVDLDSSTLILENLIAGSYSFSVLVTDNFGLTATDEVSVTVLEAELFAKPHNVFTPDNRGDITTETWTIDNADLLNGCEVVVYNRQGQRVYTSQGYPTPWDGTMNGKPVPDGAYFYVIKCSSQKSQTGSVTIVRAK